MLDDRWRPECPGVPRWHEVNDYRCADCRKLAPIHYYRNDWTGKREVCCRSFHYYVKNRVWAKAEDAKSGIVRQLCLYCLRKRLRRKLTAKDFCTDRTDFNGQWFTSKRRRERYVQLLVAYANSGRNTSRVW